MESSFVVRKDDGEEVSVDDTPANRQKAKAKGLDVYEALTSPTGEETLVAQHLAAAAIKKGYQFSDTYTPAPKREHIYSPLESGAMGYAESASLGTDDEIFGRLKQLRGEDYKTARNNYRQEKKLAERDNPEVYTGGSITGGIASGLAMPGLGLAKGAGLGARVLEAGLEGAGLGAASGYGMSDSDNPSEQAGDALRGGAVGGAMGAGITGAVGGVAKAIGAVPPLRNIARKAYEKIGEVPEHISQRILDDPDMVERARNSPGSAAIAEKVADAVNRLRKEQEKTSEEAWRALRAEDAKGKKIQGILIASKAVPIARENNVYGMQSAQKTARRKLTDAMRDVSRADTFEKMKIAIQAIDQNINWDKPENDLANTVLQRFRTSIDDDLKAIPEYKKAMIPVAAKTKAIQELQNKFGLKKGSTTVNGNIEPNFYPTDRTVTQSQTAASQSLMDNSKGTYTRKMLKDQAPEVLRGIEDEGLKQFMERDIGRGSRSSVQGAAIGAALNFMGIPVGAGPGAVIGYMRDRSGRAFAAEGLARLGRASLKAGSSVGGNVAGALEGAFKKGGNAAVVVYHTVLMKKNPEYRRAFEAQTDNQSRSDDNVDDGQ